MHYAFYSAKGTEKTFCVLINCLVTRLNWNWMYSARCITRNGFIRSVAPFRKLHRPASGHTNRSTPWPVSFCLSNNSYDCGI